MPAKAWKHGDIFKSESEVLELSQCRDIRGSRLMLKAAGLWLEKARKEHEDPKQVKNSPETVANQALYQLGFITALKQIRDLPSEANNFILKQSQGE